jgi:3'-phosphoadenosine 5'-phosphosulfate (PAPS) 3'-phosphatase
MDLKPYILRSIQAAIAAGNAINEVYHSEDFGVEYKTDKSPLTLADQKSHEIIMNVLKEFDIPILSEEGKETPYAQRKDWERFWVVDPLDGTKEFIKRNAASLRLISLWLNTAALSWALFLCRIEIPFISRRMILAPINWKMAHLVN